MDRLVNRPSRGFITAGVMTGEISTSESGIPGPQFAEKVLDVAGRISDTPLEEAAMKCWIVSDVNKGELARFARALRGY